MKMDTIASPKRKPLRLSPLLFRRIHKWVGLILGLQFVLWTVSGAVMALLDMEKVGGHGAAPPPAASSGWSPEIKTPVTFGKVEAMTLRNFVSGPVFEIKDEQGLRLADAQTGAPVTVDEKLAADIARSAFHHEGPVRSIERLEKPNLEAREHAAPMWRVNFADEENSSSYVSAVTGQPLVNRGDTWRTWDFVWMLHNMDYVNRSSFNHPLIIFVGFGALWLSFTGFYLLFKSFRRREFNWVLGEEKVE